MLERKRGGCAVWVHTIYFIMLILLFAGIQFHYLHKLESVSEMEQGIAKKKKRAHHT